MADGLRLRILSNDEQIPDTRKMLLKGLAEKGFGHEQLVEMQKIIDAEKSDLFDVLAYVARALPPLNREERATRARVAIKAHFSSKQQAFLDFVLAHYVQVGVEELDQEKLKPLLRLKVSQFHRRRPSRLGTSGGYWAGLHRLPKYLYQYQPVA
jgi:type I restriction enzyme R subunit